MLKAFASFGFCKAHAAAFALPTYQSAWLKAHHPAAFLAGVLTHDPGMYPKRLILDDARQFGIAVLSLDVNPSDASYRVERRRRPPDEPPPAHPRSAGPRTGRRTTGCRTVAPTASASRSPTSRASPRPRSPGSSPAGPTARCRTSGTAPRVSRPVVERLVVAGGLRLPLRHRLPAPVRAPGPGHPPRPAAPGRRARPVDRGPPAPGRHRDAGRAHGRRRGRHGSRSGRPPPGPSAAGP